jgi:hypothetical protein
MRSARNKTLFNLISLGILYSIAVSPQLLADTPTSLLPNQPHTLSKTAPDQQEKKTTPENNLHDQPPAKGNISLREKVGIEVSRLKDIDVESIGTIDPTTGGFAKNMWGNTSRTTIDKLFNLLPNQLYSRSLQSLYKRLLLTTAEIPAVTENSSATGLLFKRAHALFHSGYFVEFEQLIEIIPNEYHGEQLSKLRTDAAFLKNEMDRACDITSRWFEKSTAQYWQKSLIFCDALNSNWDKVDFGLNLLIELGEVDGIFFNLIQKLSGRVDETFELTLDTLQPLYVAMLRASKSGLPKLDSKIPSTWLLTSYIQDPSLGHATRLSLAEKAAKLGVIDIQTLSKIYKAAELDENEIVNAISIALNEKTPKARMLLYRATLRHESNFGKAQAIQRAQLIGQENNGFPEMAELYTAIFEQIQPGSELGWFGPDATLLHTANFNREQAKLWSSLAKREANMDQNVLETTHSYWPLIRIMWGDKVFDWDDDRMRDWWQLINKTNPRKAREVASVLYNLLRVLGDSVSPDLRAALVGPNSSNRATKTIVNNQFSIETAAKAGNLAETITLILISLDKTEFTALSTSELVLIVDSINKLGLHEEARKLAFEIMISQLF